jgi:hypothetical protein
LTDCNSSVRTLTELKIARAYVRLSSIPADNPKASVLLASIGSCEIRMFRGSEAHPDGVPLFWLELFDHSTKMSVDSFICHRLKDAVPIFDDFISQAAGLNKAGGPDDR